MAKRNQKKCNRCFRSFDTAKGLLIHTTRSHPYVPPKPPAMKHVAFIDLVRDSQWGKDYPVEGKTNPSDNDIIMGLLALIVEELRELKKEINRPKTLR